MALSLPLDEKLAESINRRRIAEELRKRRIFNAKERQIGVDLAALNHQMHEHILSRNKEDEIERYFADELRKQDNIAKLLDEQQKDEIKELNKKIDEFRLTDQRPEHGRDFDLNDPDKLKKERPPRISDNEICPVSGLQKLEGEDINYKERLKKQKEQVKDLLLQQMQEKRMENFMKSKEESDWESVLLKQDHQALQLAYEELDNSRKDFEKLMDSNKYLALETIERNKLQEAKEEYEKKKDIEHHFYSDLLTENPSVARSMFGNHRITPDRWKGMTKEQLEEIKKGQIQQIIDKQRKKELEEYETAQWQQQIMSQAKVAELEEEEERKQKYETAKKQAMENLQLAQQQKMQQQYINKVVYSNKPTDEYFSQFNTTSR